jgi:lysosomal acid lipase/cholesteryl ester hydrolase
MVFKPIAELNLDQLIYKLGFTQFMPSEGFVHDVCKYCDLAIIQDICESVLFQLFGKNPSEGHNLNVSRLETLMDHLPAGTSVKNMEHWAQMIRSQNFQRFDYGESDNQKSYGVTEVPQFDLSRIKTPVASFSGGHDPLADPSDVEKLETILKENDVLVLAHKEEEYDHADFTIGIDANTKIYPIILDLLRTYNKPVTVIA